MKPGSDTPLSYARIDGNGWYWSELPMLFAEHKGERIIIPACFMTDGASVPRLFQSFFSTTGIYLMAALLHDWLYKSDCPYSYRRRRRQADRLFLLYMKLYGVNPFTRYVIYSAVRVGGWLSFHKEKAKYHVN